MRLKRSLLYALPLAVLAFMVLVPEVSAQFGLSDAVSGTGIPKNADLAKTIGNIVRVALQFVGTLFLLLMVYSGFLWMTARGDAKKVDQAKQLIMGAVIGVIVVASAYAITDFVIKAATGKATEETGGGATHPNLSVPIGGDCTQTQECSGTGVCTGGKCTEANFGNCVPGKSCSADADCSSNGSCAEGGCLCDAI